MRGIGQRLKYSLIFLDMVFVNQPVGGFTSSFRVRSIPGTYLRMRRVGLREREEG
jgi:hypothetical protein